MSKKVGYSVRYETGPGRDGCATIHATILRDGVLIDRYEFEWDQIDEIPVSICEFRKEMGEIIEGYCTLQREIDRG